jgi:hypothetical protein
MKFKKRRYFGEEVITGSVPNGSYIYGGMKGFFWEL